MDFKDSMLMAAAMMSQDEILDRLRASLKLYDSAIGQKSRDDAFRRVQLDCAIAMTKRFVPTVKDVEEASKKIEQHERVMNMIDPKNNSQN